MSNCHAWTREISLSEALCIYNFPSSDKISGAPSLPSQLLPLNIFVILASILSMSSRSSSDFGASSRKCSCCCSAAIQPFTRFFRFWFVALAVQTASCHFFVALFALRNLIKHIRHTASYFGLLPLGRPVPSSTTSPVACQCGCFLVFSSRAKPTRPAGKSTGCFF